jgi:hypothetical protein
MFVINNNNLVNRINVNVNSNIFGFINFYIVPFFLMSQVFKVRISECPSLWVKHYGNPTLDSIREGIFIIFCFSKTHFNIIHLNLNLLVKANHV